MLKNVIKKLNNFRYTAVWAAIISGVTALYALGSFFLYHFAGPVPQDENYRITGYTGYYFGGDPATSTNSGPILGLILFLAALITLAISIYIVYSLVPYIQNKEKVTPRKGLLLAGFVGTFFNVVLIVLMVMLALQKAQPVKINNEWQNLPIQTAPGIWATLPFGVLSAIGTALYIIPWKKCDFYMPKIEK